MEHPHTDGIERLDARAIHDDLRLVGNSQRIELPVEGAHAQRGPAPRQCKLIGIRLRYGGGRHRRARHFVRTVVGRWADSIEIGYHVDNETKAYPLGRMYDNVQNGMIVKTTMALGEHRYELIGAQEQITALR